MAVKRTFLTKLIIRTVLHKRHLVQEDYSSFQLAKGFKELRIIFLALLRDCFLISIGVCSAAFGLKSFLLPANFIDGGITGVSLLSSELSNLPLWVFLLTINIPFVILGYNVVGKQFAIKTAIAIPVLALVIATVSFPLVTHDKLLVALFGGFFLGAGIGFSVRGGAVLDGTEILAIYLSKKFGTSIGDIIIAVNVIVFGTAAYFLSVEAALYSMITYLAASKTLDFVIEGIEEYTGVTIISHHSEKMKKMIAEKMGRGVTVYRGKGGYGKRGHVNEVDIVYTVITRLEISKLNTEIEKIDPHAFVVMNSVKDTKGGMVKKRPLHH